MKTLLVNIFSLLIVSATILINGCIEDNISPPLTGELNPVAEMLVYFEAQGDFPNNDEAPALVEAEEVYSNINNYLLIDIRQEDEFVTGHIENAVNIKTDSLFDFVDANVNSGYQKIIIISKNGQSSAYFTSLLRLAGFDNVFSMDYGMAAWNETFAEDWLNKLTDYGEITNFTNDPFEKNEYEPLPQISIANPGDPIETRLKSRIKEVISLGFKQNTAYVPNFPPSFQYIVCYGSSHLYKARKFGVFDGLGHPVNARSYLDSPFFELRSVNSLQTLPNSEPILLYDYNGQLGASMTAYLRVLGYDVKMLLFGANQIFYSRMIDDPGLINYTFSSGEIKNYPYITGN